MLGILDNIKAVAIGIILILLVLSGLGNWFLIQTNESLKSDIVLLNVQVEAGQTALTKMQSQIDIFNATLKEQIEAEDIITDTFDGLNNDLNTLACDGKSAKVIGSNVSDQKDAADVAADIAAVGRLLDQASCTANHSCRPPSSPPERL